MVCCVMQATVAPAVHKAEAAHKAAVADAQALKVDIKATHDNLTPVELLVKPAEDAAPKTPPAAEAATAATVEAPSAPALPEAQLHAPQQQGNPEATQPEVEVMLATPRDQLLRKALTGCVEGFIAPHLRFAELVCKLGLPGPFWEFSFVCLPDLKRSCGRQSVCPL